MSEFQDKQMTCVDCVSTFVWSADDQAYDRDKGYVEPRRGNPCVQARKDRFGF